VPPLLLFLHTSTQVKVALGTVVLTRRTTALGAVATATLTARPTETAAKITRKYALALTTEAVMAIVATTTQMVDATVTASVPRTHSETAAWTGKSSVLPRLHLHLLLDSAKVVTTTTAVNAMATSQLNTAAAMGTAQSLETVAQTTVKIARFRKVLALIIFSTTEETLAETLVLPTHAIVTHSVLQMVIAVKTTAMSV